MTTASPDTWTIETHATPLTTLEAKADPDHTALIVIDVLNDFCSEQGMMAKEGCDVSAAQQMAERLPDFLDLARSSGALVIFVRNIYSTARNHYLSDVWLEQAARRRGDSYTRSEVCAPDSWNGEFYGPVKPERDDAIVTKHRFSAFLNTDLDLILRANAIRTVVLTGVATNVCVETTAREAFMRDYYVLFTEDGTATYSPEEHEATLRTIDRFFGQVVSLDDVSQVWAGMGAPTGP